MDSGMVGYLDLVYEVTHLRPIDRVPGTWYPEARSPLLSRGHRAAIFLGAPTPSSGGNKIAGNAALRLLV